jgi:hypothetical protein
MWTRRRQHGCFHFLDTLRRTSSLVPFLHIPPENRIRDGTLAFASVYRSIIDIPGVNLLDRACFSHWLFASITYCGILAFCASAVAPRLNDR